MAKEFLSADAADFAPPLLRIQEEPPAPFAGWMLRLLVGLLAGIALWAVFGQLDIVAVADGKLVPSSYLKIVQPAEQGIVREILVKEGEAVREGQVLIRMDSRFAGTVNNLKGVATVVFIAHQLPKGLAVDAVETLREERTMSMQIVEDIQS